MITLLTLGVVLQFLTLGGIGALWFRKTPNQKISFHSPASAPKPPEIEGFWSILRKADDGWHLVGHRPEGHPDIKEAHDSKILALVNPQGEFVRGNE